MEPISVLNNRPARVTREVEVRPLTQTGLDNVWSLDRKSKLE